MATRRFRSPRRSIGAASDASSAPGEWYMVAFRSIRRIDADEERLTEFDERAHLEAAARARASSTTSRVRRARPVVPVVLPVDGPPRGPRRCGRAAPRRGRLAARRDVRVVHARVRPGDGPRRRTAALRALRPSRRRRPASATRPPSPLARSVPRCRTRSRARRRGAARPRPPPTDVTSRMSAWTSRAIANAAFGGTPNCVAMPTAVSSNVPR